MAASTPIPLNKASQKAFMVYYDNIQNLVKEHRHQQRMRMLAIDRNYQRELDKAKEHQRAKAANAAGDSDRFQNVTVPVVMPQVETAVTYQTSVFLTGTPIFGVVASPSFIDEALQLETVIDNQAVRGGWTRELIMFLRDGAKYNFAPVEVPWDREVTFEIATELEKSAKEGIPKETLWEGNKVKRLNPYNTFTDPRVPASECYKRGEFEGYTERVSRIELKSFIATLPDTMTLNVTAAFESQSSDPTTLDASDRGYFIPDVNPAITNPEQTVGFDWMAWASLSSTRKGNINYKESYDLTTLYCRIIPSEFDLRVPSRNIPQIYKLIIVNHSVIIYCEKQTNAHNMIPILVGQPMEDGLSFQTKSLAENAVPFQQVASAFMNSIVHSRRRAITDRVLYDPSRVAQKDINSDNPSAKIPVRPTAYGKNVSEAVYPFPYREDQAAFSMQQIQSLLGLANHLSGQNQASQGQFVKGNKTLHEFESVMQNANGRDQLTSILLEAQVLMPLKQILKFNILQYQGGTSLYNRDKRVAVEIDPVQLRNAVLEFKISDGLIPSSKLINADSWSVALQVLGSSPQIAGSYNIGPMFSYMMKTQGAAIAEFEKSPEQVEYEKAVANWQQIAAMAVEKGTEGVEIPPQPKPADYGWNPSGEQPAGTTNQPEPKVE